MNGQLIAENRIKLIETPNREVLNENIQKNGGVQDPQFLKAWGRILKNWIKSNPLHSVNFASPRPI